MHLTLSRSLAFALVLLAGIAPALAGPGPTAAVSGGAAVNGDRDDTDAGTGWFGRVAIGYRWDLGSWGIEGFVPLQFLSVPAHDPVEALAVGAGVRVRAIAGRFEPRVDVAPLYFPDFGEVSVQAGLALDLRIDATWAAGLGVSLHLAGARPATVFLPGLELSARF